ncbi:MAG: type II toxin-antitoxin system RelE/ParE family toxin [Pseudomonadota bacterium]|nr:type II toxin-antitoxin system RelE/ParE family toxin [Pseudomonadota bacterium]
MESIRIYKLKWFKKWASKEGLSDSLLKLAIEEIKQGLVDADLGANVYKKRVPLLGQGKSGSLRTLIAFQVNNKAFFIYGFSKSTRSNISVKEMKSLKLLAKELLNYSEEKLKRAIDSGSIEEVR